MAAEVTLTIDGTEVTVPQGTLLVEAAKTINTDVPVYCYHPKLGPAGLCRICLVDVEKTPKLQIACNTVVSDGMVVHTYGPKVAEGRRAVMEFLLLNHPLDCPICDKGGECDLQDYSMAYGQSASRLADAKSSKPKAIDLGPTIVLDDERCIVCQRCSRFDDIITHEQSLVVKDRGQRDVIATATGEPYRSNFSGNVTELCPVGALTSKTYRFKSRPWDNNRTQTTCSQCSVGCQLSVDERYGNVQRTLSVPADEALSDGWLCDRGRYNIAFLADERRVVNPLLRRDGEYVQIAWDDAIELWATRLRAALAEGGPGAVAVLGGGRLLNEEIVLLGHVMRALGVANLDWRVGRQRHASLGSRGGSYLDLERANAIVAIGRPPSQTAPVLDLRVRKAVARGARYVTVGAHAAESFVPARRVASIGELGPLVAGAERVAFIWDGIDPSAGREAAALMATLATSGVTVSGFVPGEQPNARGAEALGLLPGDGGRDAAAVLAAARAGTIATLALFGANPVLHHPSGPEAVRAALERVPFLVVSELFMTETARLADLILPARAFFEKTGHVYDLAADVLPVRSAHGAPDGTLSDGDMLVALAAELAIELPDPGALLAAARAPVAPAAAFDAAPQGAPQPANGDDAAPGGLRLAVAAHIFAGGGTVWFDDRLAELRPQPSAAFAPETAAVHGVRPGDRLDLVAGDRTLRDLVAEVREDAAPGIVVVIDGLPAAPASAFADGEAVRVENVRPAGAGVLAGAGGVR